MADRLGVGFRGDLRSSCRLAGAAQPSRVRGLALASLAVLAGCSRGAPSSEGGFAERASNLTADPSARATLGGQVPSARAAALQGGGVSAPAPERESNEQTLAVTLSPLELNVAVALDAGVETTPSAPTDLSVGDRSRPMNVEGVPLFAWLPHDGPNEIQSAYQLRVTTTSDGRVLWDSEKVASSEQSYVPYAGPELASQTSYSWSVRSWDRDDQVSPWAAPAQFDTGLDDSDWEASWIRRRSTEPDDYTLARREFLVTDSPVLRARAYVAANHQYELYLNGALVDRGTAFSYPGEGYYQATDVGGLVRAGEPLAIGALTHWYGAGQGRPAGERGLLVRLVIDHADGTRQVVVTDGAWRVARATEWQTQAPRRNGDGADYVERIDARQAQLGWNLPGYDVSGAAWLAPEVVGQHPAGVFTHLVGREARVSSTPVAPVSVQTLSDGAVVADFGKVMSARPMLHFESGTSGRSLALLAGYRLLADGHVASTELDTQGTDLSFGFIQTDGAQDLHGFTHFAWRYLQIAAPGAPLGALTIGASLDHVDVPPNRAATFQSSNPVLDAVFELLQRSGLYSGVYQFVDTPTREKGQFLADAINISYATMAGYLERDLTQQALVEFAHSQARYWPDGRLNAVYPNGDGRRDIPDFTEMYPGWVSRYYLSTGDRSLLGQLYPVLVNIAGYVWSYRNETTGLITNLAGGSGPYLYGIVEWPASGRNGYDMTSVARTTQNVLAVDVMRSVASAAEALGRPSAERDFYAQRATELTAAINARLRRSDGIYVDGLSDANLPSPHASQHANSYALAYEVAPPEDRERIASYVASLGMQQGPMTAHWLLEALGRAERADDVVTRLTDAVGPGWGNILANGATFTWEAWALAGSESESHGWGAQALVDFQQTLLGVRVTSPGAATIAIVLPRTALRFARGTVPTQRGPVVVDWRREDDGTLTLTVDVPVNVRAMVSLPVTATAGHRGSGEGAPVALGVEDGRALYETGSGRSEFSVQ